MGDRDQKRAKNTKESDSSKQNDKGTDKAGDTVMEEQNWEVNGLVEDVSSFDAEEDDLLDDLTDEELEWNGGARAVIPVKRQLPLRQNMNSSHTLKI